MAGGRAFTFRYAETEELLRAAGCTVVGFDPMVDRRLPDSQRPNRHVRQPAREDRIDRELLLVRVGVEAQNSPKQMKHASRGPRLRHIGAQILNREGLTASVGARIQFR